MFVSDLFLFYRRDISQMQPPNFRHGTNNKELSNNAAKWNHTLNQFPMTQSEQLAVS